MTSVTSKLAVRFRSFKLRPRSTLGLRSLASIHICERKEQPKGGAQNIVCNAYLLAENLRSLTSHVGPVAV